MHDVSTPFFVLIKELVRAGLLFKIDRPLEAGLCNGHFFVRCHKVQVPGALRDEF